MSMRAFNARGEPPGTMARRGSPIDAIFGIPGIPGGTLMNPVQAGGIASRGAFPKHSGTGSVVSRNAVNRWAANFSRGTGPAHSRAPERVIYAGAKTPGVHSNGTMIDAIVQADIRNPAVARHLLMSSMVAGSTRIG